MKNFGEHDVEAFTSWLPVLALVDQLVVGGVMHCPAAKEDAHNQVEVSLEEVNDTELVQFEAARFFLDHYIDDGMPSFQLEVELCRRGCEAMDHL